MSSLPADWARLDKLYQEFALTGRNGLRFLDLLWEKADQLEVCDPPLQRAFVKAFGSGHMVDIEKSKELFHARIKFLPPQKLGGVDPKRLFAEDLQICPGRTR